MAIEVFELPENEDVFSPSDLDTSKLSHKFKEVSCWSAKYFSLRVHFIIKYILWLENILRIISFQKNAFQLQIVQNLIEFQGKS